MTVKKILFVDDQPNILSGLRRMLRSMRKEWDMHFVDSGQDALSKLEAEPFDVLVTDMRMPGMDGAELLEHVVRDHPHVARIVLSGQTELEQFLRTVGPAHQFLSKPCTPETLKETITMVSAIQELISGPDLRALVSRIQTLPTRSEALEALQKELNSDEPSIMRVGELVAQDIGLTVKLIQLVNSAYFGIPQRVSDPKRAAMLLGLDLVRTLVLSMSIFSRFEGMDLKPNMLEELWRHSAAVAAHTKIIAKHEGYDDELTSHAFLAGMLHDIGKLALASQLPERYQEAKMRAKAEELQEWDVERQTFNATHAELGGYLAGLWGLPYAVMECLFYHHTPSACPHRELNALAIVHVANAIESQITNDSTALSIDEEFLTDIKLLERAQRWYELCAETAEGID